MAFFDRGDEANSKLTCQICSAKCSEHGLTMHISKCSSTNRAKFEKGDLERCAYDSSHIVRKGHMSGHLEFCNKYQNQLVEEYQKLNRACNDEDGTSREDNLPPTTGASSSNQSSDNNPIHEDNSWAQDANSEAFVGRMSLLNLSY